MSSRVYLRYNAAANWTEVDTDATEEVRFTFTLDDLANPTNYVSERSVSLKLPRTAKNNDYFGQSCRLDSLVTVGGYTPAERMQYMCFDSAGMLISTGDAVVSEINARQYVLSLVGSQARLFRKMLNAGWDKARAAEDSDYTLLPEPLDGLYINADAVYTSWIIDNPLFELGFAQSMAQHGLLKSYYGLSADTHVTDDLALLATMVGFAPTAQGRYKDFESSKWIEVGRLHATLPLIGDVDVRPASVYLTGFSILPVLCSVRDFKNQPEQSIDVGDGLIEPQLREFRSYYQQPYIYIAALWHLLRSSFSAITGGYTLNLDGRWFNSSNDDLRRLVYMLPNLYANKERPLANVPVSASHIAYVSSVGTGNNYPTPVLSGYQDDLTISDVATLTAGKSAQFNGVVTLSYGLSVSTADTAVAYFTTCNCITLTIGLHRNGAYLQKFYAICPIPTDEKITEDDYWNDPDLGLYDYVALGYEVVFPTYTPTQYDLMTSTPLWTIEQILGSTYQATADSEAQIIYAEFGMMNSFQAFKHWTTQWILDTYPPKATLGIDGTVATTECTRSGSPLSMERLFGELNPAEILMQYTKSRHMLWLVDDSEREVTVVRAADYFADAAQAITDITLRVDTSKDMAIRPLSWDSHKVVLNMDAIEADYIDGYADKYGIEYGSKAIVTQNALNGDTLELLGDSDASKIKTSALLSILAATRESLLQTVQEYSETPPMPLNVKDGESADVHGNFYYRHDNAKWYDKGTDAKQPLIHITDDMAKEVLWNTYAWHGNDAFNPTYDPTERFAATQARPVFNTVSEGGLSVLFAPVREVYTATPDEPTLYLYERCWQNYIGEVYNLQNKTLEAYISLPRRVFDTVRRNPFVIIDHVLYLLTEICGWSEGNTTVRCTLRQIMDINKLTT